MKRERTWLRPWMVGVAAILLLAGIAEATGGGLRAVWIHYFQSASAPGTSGTDRCWWSSVNDHAYCTDTSNVDHDLFASGGYSTIDQSGTPLTQRSTVNFTGSGVSCVDNSGASRTDCTISGGGGGTLASTYSATTPASNLITEAAGGEGVIEKAYAGQTTPLHGYESSGGTVVGAQYQNGKTTGAGYYDPATLSTGIDTNGGLDLLLLSGGNTVTVPLVTGTLACTDVAQTISAKQTYSSAPEFSAGLTASGSAANDFSGSTGAFTTSTGNFSTGNGVITATNAASAPAISSGIAIYGAATTPTIAPPSGGTLNITNPNISLSAPLAIGTAQTPYISLVNTTAATSGAGSQQWSPGVLLGGQQWNGSASVPVDAIIQTSPITSSTAIPDVVIYGRYNGGSWSQMVRVTKAASDIRISSGAGTGAIGTQVGELNLYNTDAAANPIVYLASGALNPYTDNSTTSANPTRRWSEIASYWYDTKQGSQLTAAATITPTAGQHHVTGATSITTIATTNVPASSNVTLTLIADGGTITWATGGNIAVGGTIAVNKAQRFVYDSAGTTWYPVQ